MHCAWCIFKQVFTDKTLFFFLQQTNNILDKKIWMSAPSFKK